MQNCKLEKKITQSDLQHPEIFSSVTNLLSFLLYKVQKSFRRLQFFSGQISFHATIFLPFWLWLGFEYYLYKHFRFCFQLFSSIILRTQKFRLFVANLQIFKTCFKIWTRRGFESKNSTKSLPKLSSLTCSE